MLGGGLLSARTQAFRQVSEIGMVLETLVKIHENVFLCGLLFPAHEVHHHPAIRSFEVHHTNCIVVVRLHVEVVFVSIHDWIKCAQILEPSDHP